MIYEEDGDQVVQVGDECPHCGSEHTEYDRYYKYWKCESCSTVWGDAIEEAEDEELLCERCDRLLNLPVSYSGGICFDCLQREGVLGKNQ